MTQLHRMAKYAFSVAVTIFCVAVFSGTVQAQRAPFTFAWLSDTHVGGITGAEDLQRSVDDINANDTVRFVVLSGDITEMGWNEEFHETRRILSGLRVPYRIVPGNHDLKWSESGGEEFSRTFGSDRFVFEHEGILFLGVHQGPILRMGDGHFPPEDVRWIDSLTTSLDPATPLIFITHYPLTPSIDNWYEATTRLRKLNTQAVLVGHGHADRVMDFGGLPGVMGRSNQRARQEFGGYNLVHVANDSIRFFERITGQITNPQRHALPIGLRVFVPVEETIEPAPALDLFARGMSTWSVKTGWTITAAPAVWKEYVYVADRSGRVQCLRLSDGRMLWSTAIGSAILGNPDVRDGAFVGTAADGSVFCLNAINGEVLWKKAWGSANLASPRIVDEKVYVGSSDGAFRALRLRNGDVLWRFDSVGAFVESRALVTDDAVVFGAWDSYLYCLDRTSGALRWKWNNGTTARLLSPAAVWPVASGDHVFVVAPDRAATVLDLKTGKEVWRSKAHQVRESAGMSEDGARFYAKSMNDTLYSYDAQAKEESMKWMTDCRYGYDIANSMPMEKEGTVYFGTKNGLVYALNGKSGAVEWVHKFGNSIINTVAPVLGRRVVVTNLDGEVALLRAGDK